MTPLPRSQFAVTGRYVYLNHAATGIIPQLTRDALGAFVGAQAEEGVVGVARYEMKMPAYRAHVGQFIGATGAEIGILRNTTDGANVVALGSTGSRAIGSFFRTTNFPRTRFHGLRCGGSASRSTSSTHRANV